MHWAKQLPVSRWALPYARLAQPPGRSPLLGGLSWRKGKDHGQVPARVCCQRPATTVNSAHYNSRTTRGSARRVQMANQE